MFPMFGSPCWPNDSMSRKSYQERKLKFLKWVREDLEARLAGLNASIATIERQISQEES
ncbi:conserved hypothetical protein [Gloeothece citriformis PCC 7424]|uniref:Uncharacterized protein n=1 Tax=Gloeothece citriformis (strain PCC 7424) TaxID=65393 RepID=B7KK68_GLOC7|nr:hypothetical protein [Gloeothece citriformis]ACK70953.1 conserved hypothetical protein [Gloeothece citriformis PCC 7424]